MINSLCSFQSHASQRSHALEKKRAALLDADRERKSIKKSLKDREAQKREEGLERPIDQSNKGFAMLAKMGYKQGEANAQLLSQAPSIDNFRMFNLFR